MADTDGQNETCTQINIVRDGEDLALESDRFEDEPLQADVFITVKAGTPRGVLIAALQAALGGVETDEIWKRMQSGHCQWATEPGFVEHYAGEYSE